MEVPASLFRIRIAARKEERGPNGTEMALAALIYSHARADHDVPVCTRSFDMVAKMLGRSAAKVRAASHVLEAAGYWRRVRVGRVWRWEILIRPGDDGHRWADVAAQVRPIGSAPERDQCARSGVLPNGISAPDRDRLSAPERANQHQQEIREEASACAPERECSRTGSVITMTERSRDRVVTVDPRLALADAINAQTERHREASERHPRAVPRSVDLASQAAVLDRRYRQELARWPSGSAERQRLSACRLASPVAGVLDRAIDDLGSVEQVADVLAWAWDRVARGEVDRIGSAPAAKALVEAFRGEGRYWRGILDARAATRPPDTTRAAWVPPDIGDDEAATPEQTAALWASWEARAHVGTAE